MSKFAQKSRLLHPKHLRLDSKTIDKSQVSKSRCDGDPSSNRSSNSSKSEKSAQKKRPKITLKEKRTSPSVLMSYKDRAAMRKEQELRKSFKTMQEAAEKDSAERERLEMRTNEMQSRIAEKIDYILGVERDAQDLDESFVDHNALVDSLEGEIARLEQSFEEANGRYLAQVGLC